MLRLQTMLLRVAMQDNNSGLYTPYQPWMSNVFLLTKFADSSDFTWLELSLLRLREKPNCGANDREVHYSYLFHTCIVTAIQNTRSVGYITARNSKQSQTEGFSLLSYLRVHDGHCT